MFNGFAEWFRGDMNAALQNLEAAHQLDPRSSRTTYNLANLYFWLHKYAQGDALVTTGRVFFPDAPEFQQLAFQSRLQQGNLEGGRALFAHDSLSDHALAFVAGLSLGWMFAPALDQASRRRVLGFGPQTFNGDVAVQRMAQAMIYAAEHDTVLMKRAADDAVATLESVARLPAPDPERLVLFGQALAYAGRKAEAMAIAARTLAIPALGRNVFARRVAQQGVALIYAHVGEPDKATDLLGSLTQVDDYCLTPAWLGVDPALEPLHGDQRFERLIARR